MGNLYSSIDVVPLHHTENGGQLTVKQRKSVMKEILTLFALHLPFAFGAHSLTTDTPFANG